MLAINRTPMIALLGLLGCISSPLAWSQTTDTDLKPGFPVQTWRSGGTYHGGPHVHATVGNIDADPELEIVFSALATGPLYAFNHDGTEVSGWPVDITYGVGLPVIARLLSDTPGQQLFAGYWGTPGPLSAFDGAGNFLPGWPRSSNNYVSTSPSAADIDGDGVEEVFVCEQDASVHAYRADGASVPGWPVRLSRGAQSCATPAIADLDADGTLEILTVTSPANGISYMYAFRANATPVAGFPVSFQANADTYPVVGDVDGDGALEIVVVAKVQSYPYWHNVVQIYTAQGQLEREIHADEFSSKSAAPALADLDGNGIADIVMQGDAQLFAWRGTDGALLPGWPAVTGDSGNSAPVVGDVDGDGQPDVVVTNALNQVRLFNRFGVSHPRFPKSLPLGAGAMPAIADLDRDGRNEIIIIGSHWNGFAGYYDNLWVYDLQGPAHGRIEWGQFGNDHRHQSRYVAVSNDGPRADLGMTLAANQQTIHVGDALTYTITVTNNGPAPATNVQVLQSLSLHTTFQSASAQCRHASHEVACTLAELASGSSHTFTVAVTGAAAGSAETTANVAATQVDPSLENNAASIVTSVSTASADLSITISDTPDPARLYRDLNYAISVVNYGPDTASGIRVEFRFPAGVSQKSVPANCTAYSDVAVCNVGSLSSGDSAVVNVTAMPQFRGTISATATASAGSTDPVSGNNSATAVTTVKR